MLFTDFENLSIWTNALVFAGAAVLIWFSGIRLEKYADAVSQRTGLSHAFVGVLMLAAATSLPEFAATVSGSLIGNATLVVHNLIGAVITQMAILSASGWLVRGRVALTYFSPDYVLLFAGVGVIAVLVTAIAGIAAGPALIAPDVDVWPLLIFVTYVLIVYITYRLQFRPRWVAVTEPSPRVVREHESEAPLFPGRTLGYILGMFAVAAGLVFVGGWTSARVADALAVQTGLGSGFVGVTLLAFATGLPELSTTIAAVRRRNYGLAIANIFGTNAFNVSLLFVAELTFRGGAVLQYAHRSATFAAALGILMVCVYLWGMLEREDRTVLGIGLDSAIVLALYAGGLVVIYLIR